MVFDGRFFFRRKILRFPEGLIEREVIDRRGTFLRNVVKEEVIGRDMQRSAKFCKSRERRVALSGLPFGDVDVRNADFFGKLGLSQPPFFPQRVQFFSKIHDKSNYIANNLEIKQINTNKDLTCINLIHIISIILYNINRQ